MRYSVSFIICRMSLLHILFSHLCLVENADEVDHVSSLERAAHTTLCLVQDLQSSTEQVSTASAPVQDSNALPSLRTPLDRDTERAQFLMKLAPRIRRLESDTVICLSATLERVLKQLQQKRQENDNDTEDHTEVRMNMLCCACRFARITPCLTFMHRLYRSY